MSRRERKSSSRKTPSPRSISSMPRDSSSTHSTSHSPEFANIYIKIYNFDNLQYLFEDNSEFEIVAKFLNERINSSNETRFRCDVKNSFEITFTIQVDVKNEEDIFNLCANPILLSLVNYKLEKEIVLGNCNLDMLSLCTTHVEMRTFQKLHFERENIPFRKFSFDCELSNDVPLLRAPYRNILILTFKSIHNFDIKDKITFGFQAPLACRVSSI